MTRSFGDVTAEYRALTEGAALVEPMHDLLWVEGPDAVSFLQGILSQEIVAMPEGGVRRSLLLGPQGRIEALLWLLRGADRVGILTDAGYGAKVAERLGYYRIRVKAEIRQDGRPIREIWGPEAPDAAGVGDGWSEGAGTLTASTSTPSLPRAVVAGDAEIADLRWAGSLAATAVRVEAGEPVMGRDIDEDTIPHETGLIGPAVDFGKGCFTGYELVERMESRGANPPRRLRGLAVTRNLLPPDGAGAWHDDNDVGSITSVAESLRVGAPIGLSLLRRSVGPGDEVEIRWDGGSSPAVVRELPFV